MITPTNRPTIDVEIRGRKFEVWVSSVGEFRVAFNDETLSATTLDELKKRLERAVKREKIEPVEFLHWTGEKMRRGKCHGIRANSSHLIIVWEDENRPTQEWSLDSPIGPEREPEYRVLCDACVAADKARAAFEKKHGFDMREAISSATAALEQKGGAS
jgi:hypothetical protein